ncbi:MAG: hypothetical protein JWQ38_314, partial [Flavipsychrobacter sp.]|nr:hypothetical protein [Flavipsychrobacter sp.]
MKLNTSLLNNTPYSRDDQPVPTGLLFGIVWVVLFVLYYPAAKAGFVTDYTGWLDQVKNHAFREYINRTNFHAVSMYQVTQLTTYVFYKLFGINAWLWHLLFITLHTINACLLYIFSRSLLYDAGVANNRTIPLIGVLLFCVSPYLSEVIVWEPAFHFLTGLMFILIILRCVQLYVHSGSGKYIGFALLVYLASLFTLEVFYITPWLVLAVGLFYRFIGADKKNTGNIVRYFFAPALILFILRLGAFYLLYGSFVSRIGTSTVTSIGLSSFGKPAKYLFHLL